VVVLSVTLLPWQNVVGPAAVIAATGMGVTVIEVTSAGPAPQVLFACTLIVPLVVPAVTVMLLVVLVPVNPPGKFQV
jgi:hypothetical protein